MHTYNSLGFGLEGSDAVRERVRERVERRHGVIVVDGDFCQGDDALVRAVADVADREPDLGAVLPAPLTEFAAEAAPAVPALAVLLERLLERLLVQLGVLLVLFATPHF